MLCPHCQTSVLLGLLETSLWSVSLGRSKFKDSKSPEDAQTQKVRTQRGLAAVSASSVGFAKRSIFPTPHRSVWCVCMCALWFMCVYVCNGSSTYLSMCDGVCDGLYIIYMYVCLCVCV
jgi:hypothetical protein